MARITPKGINNITYLTGMGDGSMFYHQAVAAFDKLPEKLQKQPPAQWVSTLKSLTNKGVKALELADFKMLERIEASSQKSLTRDEVREILLGQTVTLKEIDITNKTKYRDYSFASSDPLMEYHEVMIVMNSDLDNANDRLYEIDWELDNLNFDLELLARDPDIVFKLINEKEAIEKLIPEIPDFTRHHWGEDKQFKNLVLHMRYCVKDGVLLVNELQSDWAQKGRKDNWQNIPKAPFVTDTKLWTQLAVNRILQIAAKREDVHEVSWIRGHMRNGWNYEEGHFKDGLDDFYTKTVAGITQKKLGDTSKVQMKDLDFGDHKLHNIQCFEMTDAAREKLKEPSPLYSLTRLLRPNEGEMSPQQLHHIQTMAKDMLGSPRHVLCLRSVTDLNTLQQVAGTYFKDVIRVNLRAKEPVFVFNHEAFHFAQDNFISKKEQEYLNKVFAHDTGVTARVRNALLELNEPEAAAQCSNPKECQSHAFALWATGQMSLQEMAIPKGNLVERLFKEVRNVLQDLAIWVNVFAQNEVKKERESTVEGIFNKLRGGEYAKEAARERFDELYEKQQDLESSQLSAPIHYSPR